MALSDPDQPCGYITTTAALQIHALRNAIASHREEVERSGLMRPADRMLYATATAVPRMTLAERGSVLFADDEHEQLPLPLEESHG